MSKNENSPSKPQRILVEQESQATVAVSTPAFLSLAKKAGKSKYSLTVLEQVYCRGILASKHHPKNTPEQQAFNRVDSFIHEGKAYELDKDLLAEWPPIVPDGKKHMYVIKNAIKNHEKRTKPLQLQEDWATTVGVGIGKLALGALGVGRKKKQIKAAAAGRSQRPQTSNDPDDVVKRKIQAKEISHRVERGWKELHPELSQRSKNIQRKKEIVRKSLHTGEKLSGEPLRLKTKFQTVKDAVGRKRRTDAISHVAKKTGMTDTQVRQSVGVPVRQDQKEKIDYNKSQNAAKEYQKYWDERKKKKPGSGIG